MVVGEGLETFAGDVEAGGAGAGMAMVSGPAATYKCGILVAAGGRAGKVPWGSVWYQ
jgi:hypothetical protein